jgi:threonine synthase
MTTVNSDNVFNIALDGNFDDCQKFVKSMFADENFSRSINMSGVNSINWARIVVQIVYYFYSYFKIAKKGEKINFSVPTGNFGDIYAGYIAKKMGLPINKLIIATNKNDILKRVFHTGFYKPSKVIHTVSPSMDIQVASNFERLIFDVCSCDSNKTLKLMNDLNEHGEFKLENNELKKIKENFYSESLSETETKTVIEEVYKNEGILIDPHTAVAFGVVSKMSLEADTIILATAHPSKFSDVVMNKTSVKPELPDNLKNILLEKEKYDKLPNNLKKIQNYILERI